MMRICKFCNAECDNEWTQRVHHACCQCDPASNRGAIPYSLMPIIGELLHSENKRLVEECLEGSVRNGGLMADAAALTTRLAAAEAAMKAVASLAGKDWLVGQLALAEAIEGCIGPNLRYALEQYEAAKGGRDE